MWHKIRQQLESNLEPNWIRLPHHTIPTSFSSSSFKHHCFLFSFNFFLSFLFLTLLLPLIPLIFRKIILYFYYTVNLSQHVSHIYQWWEEK